MAQTIYLANMQVRKAAIKVSKKKCVGKCGEVKPIDEFGKESYATDGHKNECKKCLNEKQYERKREKKRERELCGII